MMVLFGSIFLSYWLSWNFPIFTSSLELAFWSNVDQFMNGLFNSDWGFAIFSLGIILAYLVLIGGAVLLLWHLYKWVLRLIGVKDGSDSDKENPDRLRTDEYRVK